MCFFLFILGEIGVNKINKKKNTHNYSHKESTLNNFNKNNHDLSNKNNY